MPGSQHPLEHRKAVEVGQQHVQEDDFRTEFFNLFNHPQFGAPGLNGYGADLASPSTFAVVNYTVNNPRLVQFALKLVF